MCSRQKLDHAENVIAKGPPSTTHTHTHTHDSNNNNNIHCIPSEIIVEKENIFNMSASIASVVGGAVQSAGQFDELISKSAELYREQQQVAAAHHYAMRVQSNTHHEQHAEHAHVLYEQTIFQQDALAVKEMMRDVWQQKNEVCQTRMICATLMFGCCFSTVSDGFPQLPGLGSVSGDAAAASSNTSMVPSGTNYSAETTIEAIGVHGRGVLMLSLFLMLAVCHLLSAITVTIVAYRRLARYDVDRPLRRYRTCGHVHREFWTFYVCQCGHWEMWGLRLLYVGMVFTAATVLSLQALKYEFVYGGNALWTVEPVLIAIFFAGVAGATTAQLLCPDITTLSPPKS